MSHTSTRKHVSLVIALALTMSGPSLMAEPGDSPIPARWIGYTIGLRAPAVQRLAPATIVRRQPGADADFTIPETAGGAIDQSPAGRASSSRARVFRLVNYRTRAQYRITIDRDDVRRIRAALDSSATPAAAHVPGTDLVAPSGRPTPIPSVIGVDTRVRITPTTVFPYSAIVYLTNECSGALIADNVVLTAAHCVVNGGVYQDPGYQELWYDFAVIPALDRDPACAPGDNSETCQVKPFGEIGVESVAVAEGWLEPKGGGNGGFVQHDPDDFVDDLAVVTLQEPVGQTTGYFDYRALTEAQTTSAAFLNRGYPAPYSEEPPGYEVWEMFGDANYCWVDHFLGPVNAANRLFSQSCDTSGGHSGSPVYQWRVSLDGWRPEIAGVVSHHAFGNNYARRIVDDEEVLDVAVSFGVALLAP